MRSLDHYFLLCFLLSPFLRSDSFRPLRCFEQRISLKKPLYENSGEQVSLKKVSSKNLFIKSIAARRKIGSEQNISIASKEDIPANIENLVVSTTFPIANQELSNEIKRLRKLNATKKIYNLIVDR